MRLVTVPAYRLHFSEIWESHFSDFRANAALTGNDITLIMVGLDVVAALVGLANGIGMPLISAALYLGQFTSPLIVSPLASLIGSETAHYIIGIVLGAFYLLQAFCSRRYQPSQRSKADREKCVRIVGVRQIDSFEPGDESGTAISVKKDSFNPRNESWQAPVWTRS